MTQALGSAVEPRLILQIKATHQAIPGNTCQVSALQLSNPGVHTVVANSPHCRVFFHSWRAAPARVPPLLFIHFVVKMPFAISRRGCHTFAYGYLVGGFELQRSSGQDGIRLWRQRRSKSISSSHGVHRDWDTETNGKFCSVSEWWS